MLGKGQIKYKIFNAIIGLSRVWRKRNGQLDFLFVELACDLTIGGSVMKTQVIILIVAVCFLGGGAETIANTELHVDNYTMAQGFPLTGYIEVYANSGKDIILEKDRFFETGGFTILIKKPSGKQLEFSQKTYPVSMTSLVKPVVIPKNSKVFIPVFLAVWKGEFIFDELGRYFVEFFLFTEEGNEPITVTTSIEIVKPNGNFQLWEEEFIEYSDLIYPFMISFFSYEKMVQKTKNAGVDYKSAIDLVYVYNAGGQEIPLFLWYMKQGKEFPQKNVPKLEDWISLGSELSIRTGAGSKMWGMINSVFEDYKNGNTLSMSYLDWLIE